MATTQDTWRLWTEVARRSRKLHHMRYRAVIIRGDTQIKMAPIQMADEIEKGR